jgi:hypothetical protein
MAPTQSSLERLAAKASKLNSKTDELNGIFEGLEAKLETAQVGVTCWLDRLLEVENGVPSDSGIGADTGWTIGYTRIGSRWRLAARPERWLFSMTPDKEYGETMAIGDPVALVSAPRSIRVAAAGVLDDLIEALTNRVDHYLSNIEKAKATASMRD